jgi:molybdopterin-guanine dinucleotide biosynthesis protein A
LVLACDMPLAYHAVAALLDSLDPSTEGKAGGVMACAEDGRAQPLAGLYHTAELTKTCKDLAARDMLVNASVKALLANLDVQLVTVPAGSTSDVDTWDDAAALGIAAGNQCEGQDRHSGGTIVGGNS